jgi:ComF family protein
MGWWSWLMADEGVAATVLPDSCASCDDVLSESEVAFCATCSLSLLETPSVRCSRCSEPGRFEDNRCGRCASSPVDFDWAWAPYEHAGVMARAIHRFKYEDRPDLARPLGRLLARQLPTLDGVLVPVPLHVDRFRQRGYDQATLLGAALARRLSRPLDLKAVHRVKATLRQVGLSESERDANVRAAFAAQADTVAGQPVVLVDDVFTTGATARELARTLRQAGATSVSIVTLARARREINH